ncbi:hypothetical protein ZWY2020_014386 [Hordeum vulgare]|nr:hypothetical protein ZWY2020_014386 [Hordeum vulgare]
MSASTTCGFTAKWRYSADDLAAMAAVSAEARAARPAVEVVRRVPLGTVVDDEQRSGAQKREADEVRVAECGEDEHLVAEGLGDGGGGRGR